MSYSSSIYAPLEGDIPLEGEVIDEISEGIMYASLASTKNEEESNSESVEYCNPWELEAIKVITGSIEGAKKPLGEILSKDMNVGLDYVISVSGVTSGGHTFDTHGYIAHNDKHVVLSFGCTTSAFDWIPNANTTTSNWDLEKGLAQGSSGCCSNGYSILCCGNSYKPQVHTWFYNNFLAALPEIKTYITPYLQTFKPSRTLYVVGHSLGAGIATLAACFFLTEYDWNMLPQSLVVVTSGSPRACHISMKEIIDNKRKLFGPKVRMYRVVKGQDAVVTCPPKKFGFRHLINPIMITDNGMIVLRTKEESPRINLAALLLNFKEVLKEHGCEHRDDETSFNYDKLVPRMPKALRDHMPDLYLKAILKARGLRYGSTRLGLERILSDDEEMPVTTKKLLQDDKEWKPKKHAHRAYVPKMFRKPQIMKVEPTYF